MINANDSFNLNNSSEIANLTPSKRTISTLHLKESSYNFGLSTPFITDKEIIKDNEKEYVLPDDFCFKNYSSFFHQNSYFIPKIDSEFPMYF